jgi:hypothetical protein
MRDERGFEHPHTKTRVERVGQLEVAPVGWTAGPRELVMQGFGGLGE